MFFEKYISGLRHAAGRCAGTVLKLPPARWLAVLIDPSIQECPQGSVNDGHWPLWARGVARHSTAGYIKILMAFTGHAIQKYVLGVSPGCAKTAACRFAGPCFATPAAGLSAAIFLFVPHKKDFRCYPSRSLRSLRSLLSSSIIILLIASVFLSSCSSDSEKDKQVFYYNETTGVASLDPAFARNQSIMWVVHQLYNTLVEIDSNLHIVPSLAKSWEISADRTLYTFHLRTDVFFQDNAVFAGGKGRRFTAHDAVFSLARIMDKATASSGAWIFNNRVDSSKGFIAIDDSTLQLNLLRPFQPILGILSMQYCSIIAHEAIDTYGKDFRSHPCGTGPFQLKYWDEGQAMVLEKNRHYWQRDKQGRQLPYLDAVKISFYDNKATEFLEFRQGRLSFINDIDPSFKDEVLTKKGSLRNEWYGKIILDKHAYLNTEYFGILVDTQNVLVSLSPLKMKEVRQAINYAINRKQLMMYMRNSIGTPAEAGMAPLGLPSKNAETIKGYNYNPDTARILLKRAGYNAATAPVIKLLTIPIYADMASFVAKDVQEIGVKIEVEVIQKSLLLQQTAKQQALFFRGSWIADYPDTENYMAMFYSKNPSPPNYTRYANPRFDALYGQALEETNDSLRYVLYRAMDELVTADAPVVPLFYDEVIHLVNNNVEGFHSNALNLLDLRTVSIHNP